MRGIVYTGDDAEVTDQLSVGDPGPTEVKVEIGAAGVCHSDLSVINGTIPWKAPVGARPRGRRRGRGGGLRGHARSSPATTW